MRALLITDTIFAIREREMLARLEIGLAAESVRVIHALPASASGIEAATGTPGTRAVFSAAVWYNDARIPFTLGLRAHRLIEAVRERERLHDEASTIDMVHALGGSCWSLALESGRREGVPVVLEVWRAGLIDRAVTISGKDPRVLLLAPDTTIERALRARGAAADIRPALWGVHLPAEMRTPLGSGPAPTQSPTAMIVGGGHDAPGYAGAMAGLAAVAREHPGLLIFADAQAARKSRLWRVANSLGIIGNLSCIENLESRRDLIDAGDILILPEARGEQRTTLLRAMASGTIVVAAADPSVSALQQGYTARLVGEPTGTAWAAALLGLFRSPSQTLELARSAREFVQEHRRASGHLRAVLDAYDWLTRSPALSMIAAKN